MRQSSIIIRISVALACIVVLGMATMLISYWLSEKAENDSLSINIAGSLRMQSYRIGLILASQHSRTHDLAHALKQDLTQERAQEGAQDNALEDAIAKISATWKNAVFNHYPRENPPLNELYNTAYLHWKEKVVPALNSTSTIEKLHFILDEQVGLLDKFVTAIQQDAEHKVRSFRLVQIIALFSTVFVSMLVMYSLKIKVEQPLSALTHAAKRISQGDFEYRIPNMDNDELGVLAQTLNKMNGSIGYMYETLERQVNEKTEALQQSNTALQFLYDTAKFIIENNPQGINYDEIISRLAQVSHIEKIELCLMTAEGTIPYLQIKPVQDINAQLCAAKNCSQCISSSGIVEETNNENIYRFQLNREQNHYGLIVCTLAKEQTLTAWQEQLIQSVTDQLAIGLSLKADADQSRRLAVLQERNAIARELHDSLAQALSYLKIQVARLNSAINKEDRNTLVDVADELKQGLNSAYRQLRELLTTFRLKIDGAGLKSALEFTVQQLSEQSTINIKLDFNLANIPLTPNEEIHLLQVIREASQNAIHHSHGENVLIHLWQDNDRKIYLTIEDDGVGMSDSPEKLNHYGLAIMSERGKHLGGELLIKNNIAGGVGVYFSFMPEFIVKRQLPSVNIDSAPSTITIT